MSPAATRNGPKRERGINTALYVYAQTTKQPPIGVLLPSLFVFGLSAIVMIAYIHTIGLTGLAGNVQVRVGHMTRASHSMYFFNGIYYYIWNV